jgi:uncharacterized protein
MSSYRAPRWLPGGHAQTIYAALMMRRARVAYRRERWETPDGDFIDLDWSEEPSVLSRQPPAASDPSVISHHLTSGRSSSCSTVSRAARAATTPGR